MGEVYYEKVRLEDERQKAKEERSKGTRTQKKGAGRTLKMRNRPLAGKLNDCQRAGQAGKGCVHNHDSRKNGQRRERSIAKTFDKYEAKQALLAEWEKDRNADPEYVKKLAQQVRILRHQLVTKNVL